MDDAAATLKKSAPCGLCSEEDEIRRLESSWEDVDWRSVLADLCESRRRAQSCTYPQQDHDQYDEQNDYRDALEPFAEYLPSAVRLIGEYTLSILRQREDSEGEGAATGPSSCTGNDAAVVAAPMVKDVVRALKFVRLYVTPVQPPNVGDGAGGEEEAMLLLQRARQRHAVQDEGGVRLHLCLCALLSSPTTTQTEEPTVACCRKWAAQTLCNLVTNNGETARRIALDVPLSTSCGVAKWSENDGIGGNCGTIPRMDDTEDAINSARDAHLRNCRSGSFVDMLTASGGAGDRGAIAATVAALHNCMASMESSPSSPLGHGTEEKATEGSSGDTNDCSCGDLATSVDDENNRTDITPPASFADEVSQDRILICTLLRHILPVEAGSPDVPKGKDEEQQPSTVATHQTDRDNGDATTSSAGGGKKEALAGGTLPPAASEEEVRTSPHDDDADDATEWITLLLGRMIRTGCLPQLFRSAGGVEDETLVTPEQVVLLNAASAIHASEEGDESAFATGVQGRTGGKCTADETLLFLVEQSGRYRPSLPENNMGEERYDGERQCRSAAYVCMIDILASSLQGSNHAERLYLGTHTSVIEDASTELGHIVDCVMQENKGRAARELKLLDEEQRLLKALVRLIGNLCFHCRPNQDMLRQVEVPIRMSASGAGDVSIGTAAAKNDDVRRPVSQDNHANSCTVRKRTALHVILSCTSLGHGCFGLREWAIVAIRNAMEDNQENQKVLDELSAQEAVQTPELRNLGMKIDLDRNGKVKVTRT